MGSVLFIFSLFSKERHKLGERFVRLDLHGDLWENDQIKRCLAFLKENTRINTTFARHNRHGCKKNKIIIAREAKFKEKTSQYDLED